MQMKKSCEKVGKGSMHVCGENKLNQMLDNMKFFITLTFVLIFRGLMEIIGIFVGHVYFFLMFKYPQDFGGQRFITTPSIL